MNEVKNIVLKNKLSPKTVFEEYKNIIIAYNVVMFREKYLVSKYNMLIGEYQILLNHEQINYLKLKSIVELMKESIALNEKINLSKISFNVDEEYKKWETEVFNKQIEVVAYKEYINRKMPSESLINLFSKGIDVLMSLYFSKKENETNFRKILKKFEEYFRNNDEIGLQFMVEKIEKEYGVSNFLFELFFDEDKADISSLDENINRYIKQIISVKNRFPFNLEAELENKEWVDKMRKKIYFSAKEYVVKQNKMLSKQAFLLSQII